MTDPVDVLGSVAARQARCFWLDGGGARQWSGRRSILGWLEPDDVSLTYDAAARTVTRDAITGGAQVREHRDGDDADQRASGHDRRQHRLLAEQHANGRGHAERDQRVAAHAREPVEHARDRAAKRSHHERARLERHHRDQQEQTGAETDDPRDLGAPVITTAATA